MSFYDCQVILTHILNCLYNIFTMLFSHEGGRNQLKLSDEKNLPYLSYFFLELKQPLMRQVGAGNNKAALFHLLACLSNILDKDARIFWGACGMQKTLLIAFQCFPKNAMVAETENSEQLAEIIRRAMKDAVVGSTSLFTAPFLTDIARPDTITINKRTLHLLMVLVSRERRFIPGAWDEYPQAFPPPLLDEEMVLQRYRVQPGSLKACEERASTTHKTEVNPTAHAQAKSNEALADNNDDDEQDQLDELDWIHIEKEALS